jgi:hypothetical protein
MKTLGQLTNEYIRLRTDILNLCYQLPYPQTFKEPINIEMLGVSTVETIGIDKEGFLYDEYDNTFSFEDDVVGAGELLYLLETLEEQENNNN